MNFPPKNEKKRAPRNRTIELKKNEIKKFRAKIISTKEIFDLNSIKNKTICGDTFEILKLLPEKTFDLLFADPPYNLTKNFGENSFKQTASRRIRKLARFVAERLRETFKTDGFGLHLRRLAFVFGD